MYCPYASALDPSLDINQYAHTSWTIRDGTLKSVVTTITQTPDGYLWLGTELGIIRFDGVRFVPWQPPAGENLPSTYIMKLLLARDGRLWIGTRSGLASWKDGKLLRYPELTGLVRALLEDREGTVWAGTGVPGRLCAIRNGAVECFGQDGSFGRGVGSLLEENGNLWAGADNGLWRWKPGSPKYYPMPLGSMTGLTRVEGGPLLLATLGGVRQLVGDRTEPYPIGAAGPPPRVIAFLRDRDGGLWIATADQGIWHIHKGRSDRFGRFDGLSGDYSAALFEDREGSVWVTTTDGLDRFRDLAVPAITSRQGLSSDIVVSVLPARDGSVWLGTIAGLNRWNNGQVTIYRKRDGLPEDSIHGLLEDERGRIWASTNRGLAYFQDGRFVPVGSVSSPGVEHLVEERGGSLWIADIREGLIHLLGGEVTGRIPWSAMGHKDNPMALAPDPGRGGLWIAFFEGGVLHFNGGQVRAPYAAAQGLGAGWASQLQVLPDGSVWAATAGGLSRIQNKLVVTLSARNGLPCDGVHWMMQDDEGSAWLYMPCGLARITRSELDGWIANPDRAIKYTLFDSADGVRIRANPGGYSPKVAKSPDGRVWFETLGGVSVIDPRHLPVNKLPPPVHVEEVKVDGNPWDASHGWRLPALTRDLEIHYTALSLVAPEKNRFKYKLEGRDSAWKDAGNERKASYTDLPPRNYPFRVIASNNNGVWNETGDSLDFSITPAYYQTAWFRAASVAAFLLMIWGLYRYRLYQMAREFNARLEGRVDERLRVARDLHDTLLQSFQGLLLQFQAARNMLRGRAEEVAHVLDTALVDAGQAITEARDTVQNIRSSTVITNELAKAIRVLAEELAGQQREAHGDAAAFSIEVEGAVQELHPILRDEIFRITGEALRNAFRHARARRIEVEIRYDTRKLRVRVRDDGIGIDAKVIEAGRTGHWGLPGMRERAKAIGGQLEVWSEQNAGTEVELTVPASVAYGMQGGRRFRFKAGPNS
jgi:signal transduction histidine kinase/ligand-binding sensor domain-containing protein